MYGRPTSAHSSEQGHLPSLPLSWGLLSQTIEDAVSVLKSIGLRHFWCEVVSIVQDDASHKATCIFSMGSIYDKACLTIIAGSSGSYEDGLCRVSRRRQAQAILKLD